MYRFTLIVVGKLKNRLISALCEDYAKRLQRHARIECVELRDGDVESEVVAFTKPSKSGRLVLL